MNSSAKLRTWAIMALLAAPCLTSQAAEETTSTEQRWLPWEKGSLKFGGFLATFSSDLGFSVNNAAGLTINAEELFDLDTSLTVFRAEALYRPGDTRRHQIDLIYARYNRSGSTTLSEQIEIGDSTFPVGADVDAVFNFSIIRGTYSYALLQDERMRIGVGLGIYAVPLKYEVEGQTTGGRAVVEGADTTLPLPALALRGEFQLIPRLYLNAGVDAMYLELSDFKGSLLDVNIALEYRPWNRFGIGLGYNGLAVSVEGESDSSDYPGIDFVGTVDVRFSGLMLYGKLSF